MKQRTHQATAKRLKVLKPRKGRKTRLVHITAGRDHFNARESGRTTRAKRRGRELSQSYHKSVRTLIPNVGSRA
jgi:ribosomal protein L35